MVGFQPRRYARKRRSYLPALGIAVLVMALIALSALFYLIVVVSRSFSSTALKEVIVPDLYKMDVDKAGDTLASLNLGLRIKESAYSDEVEAGKVLWQFPPADSKVKEGRIVEVVRSLGKPSLVVPQVVGLDLERAQDVIYRAGLTVGEVRKIYTGDYRRGVVVSQNPEPFRTFPSPIRVDIFVADADPSAKVAMPKLVGMRLAQAEKILFQKNLILHSVKYIHQEAKEPGEVLAQEPAPDQPIELGGKVSLTVELGEEPTNLHGRTFLVRFRTPIGLPKTVLMIEVEDALGKAKVLEEEAGPGELIEQAISATGKTKLRIFVNGKLIREDEA